jgi:hypothetical protein
VGSLLAVKQLAKCVLTIAGAGTRPGGFSGGAGVTHEPGWPGANLGPVLVYERRPDGLFQTFHVTKWFWRDPATQAGKAASAESRAAYGEPRFGAKRAKLPRKPVENPTFVAFQAQNRALLKRFSEVIEGRVI